jgi:hypothetical protein
MRLQKPLVFYWARPDMLAAVADFAPGAYEVYRASNRK